MHPSATSQGFKNLLCQSGFGASESGYSGVV
jgi:hypothetical protein